VLAYKNTKPVSFPVPSAEACDYDGEIRGSFEYEDAKKVKWLFGKGIAKNFYAIQISITSQCALPVIVPLASMTVIPTSSNFVESNTVQFSVSPGPLDSVTNVFNVDRTYNGSRAIFFNILAGATTLGSAIEQFLPLGFTQGVSITGGGFTNAAKILFPDMSSQQLQNLTTKSFGSSEQLAANSGSVQKYIFISRTYQEKELQNAVQSGNIRISFTAIPVTTSGSAVANPVH
jgi:hypothetical protein